MNSTAGNGRSCLLVEDDPLLRMQLLKQLSSIGYRVSTAAGEEAIQRARRSPPDIVIVDKHIGRWSGYEIARKLRAIDSLRSTPMILISGTVGPDEPAQALAGGFAAFMAKPIRLPELLELMVSLLSSAKG